MTHDGSYDISLIRTEQCITKEMDDVYLEVTVIKEGMCRVLAIGLSKKCPDTRDGKMPGDFNGSVGYSVAGSSWESEIRVDGNKVKDVERLVKGDTIGCGVHRMTLDGASFFYFYFTKN